MQHEEEEDPQDSAGPPAPDPAVIPNLTLAAVVVVIMALSTCQTQVYPAKNGHLYKLL